MFRFGAEALALLDDLLLTREHASHEPDQHDADQPGRPGSPVHRAVDEVERNTKRDRGQGEADCQCVFQPRTDHADPRQHQDHEQLVGAGVAERGQPEIGHNDREDQQQPGPTKVPQLQCPGGSHDRRGDRHRDMMAFRHRVRKRRRRGNDGENHHDTREPWPQPAQWLGERSGPIDSDQRPSASRSSAG